MHFLLISDKGASMEKTFNYTGVCIPGKHYMSDTTKRINALLKLIEN